MKKIFALVAVAASVVVAGCSCTPQQQYPQQVAPVVYSQPAQPQVIYRDNDSHMDAVIAGAAGVAAGKYLSDRKYKRDRRYYTPRSTYRPSRTVFTSRPAYRSSTRGSFRSRR